MSPVVAPILPANDFPDWLSPILVKELRQGLKSRAFASIAILLQGGMAFLFVLAALSGMESGAGSMEVVSGFFWFMIWIPLIIVMPARALLAIAEETKLQTLELVQMTRMQAFRIVFGKWIALCTQSLLLVLAILPYFVLRYFFGGIDLVADLTVLSLLIAASLVLTAAGLAASTLKIGLRVVAAVVAFATLIFLSQAGLFISFSGGSSFGFTPPRDELTLIFFVTLILAAYVLLFLLQAAGHLSTQAESYSPQKRMLGLVSVLIIFAAWMLHASTGFDLRFLSVLTPIVFWCLVEALVEARDPHSSHDRHPPFWKTLFQPGWVSGFFYALTLLAVIFTALYFGNDGLKPSQTEALIKEFTIFIGAVFGPALILTQLPRIRQRILLYGLIQLLFTAVYVAALFVALRPNARDEDILALLAPLPSAAALACLHEDMDLEFIRTIFPTTAVVTAFILIGFLIVIVKTLRRSSSKLSA
jgi:hypothetical protein